MKEVLYLGNIIQKIENGLSYFLFFELRPTCSFLNVVYYGCDNSVLIQKVRKNRKIALRIFPYFFEEIAS